LTLLQISGILHLGFSTQQKERLMMFVSKIKSHWVKFLVLVQWLHRVVIKLRRAKQLAFLSGLCAGLAYQLECPLWIIRTVWFFALLLESKVILPLYLILWLFVPQWEKDPEDYERVTDSCSSQ
jgi:phage shock protein PspC (stress-responsive transcriptional regulator)